jgi:ABC-type Fe3+/spermidine/putrescine transport system ATPase subunit
MSGIELKNVVASLNGVTVLDNISLKVEKGEYVSLLGPSGEGPSLLLKLISGLLPITSGTVLIDGQNVTDAPPEDRYVGFVFEQFNLFPHLTVLGNLLYGPRMRREDLELKTKVAREIISMVRLDGRETAIPRELSGGMQQRVGIARAVTAGAQILLLDQPYRALDAKIRTEMRYEIREIVKELGLTALHATHDTEEAMVTADRIAVFSKGRLEQIDTPENIFTNPKSPFVATFMAESNQYDVRITSNSIQLFGIDFPIQTKIKGDATAIIQQEAVRLYLEEPDQKDNIAKGQIINIRLLGEFIRFTVQLSDGTSITSRELLSLKWSNLAETLNKPVFVVIEPSAIKLFTKGSV